MELKTCNGIWGNPKNRVNEYAKQKKTLIYTESKLMAARWEGLGAGLGEKGEGMKLHRLVVTNSHGMSGRAKGCSQTSKPGGPHRQ